MTFTDEQLTAYLDGRLDADLAQILEEQIGEDPDLEMRLLAFERSRSAGLRDAMQALPGSSHLTSIEASIVQPPKGSTGFGLTAVAAGFAAACAFALGAVLFGGDTAAVPDRWQEQVAVYQALYVTDTLNNVGNAPNDIEEQLTRSGEVLGRDLPIEAVGDLDGLPLLRAQVLGFNGSPLIQMAYLTPEGVPVALCAVKLAGAETLSPKSESFYGLESVHWSDGTFSYMIVGDVAPERLSRMAQSLQAVF